MGLYLEDFEINATRRTRGRTIGEGDVSLFAGLVGDYNPLHVDEEFCKAEHVRQPRRAWAAGAFDRDRPDVADSTGSTARRSACSEFPGSSTRP